MGIEITLTAYNMGDCDESDFDAWTSYVADNIDDALGFEVSEIGQHPFANGPAKDTIVGATDGQAAAISQYLRIDGWDAFCSREPADDSEAWSGGFAENH